MEIINKQWNTGLIETRLLSFRKYVSLTFINCIEICPEIQIGAEAVEKFGQLHINWLDEKIYWFPGHFQI